VTAVSSSTPFRDLHGSLVFLGTGTSVGVPMVGCSCATCQSSDPRDGRTRTSVALGLPGGTLLIDTTPDLREQLLRERIGSIDAVLYTHDHVDHVYGMDDLRPICFHTGKPVSVYCEERVERRILQAFDYAFVAPASPGGGLPKVTFNRISTDPFSLLGIAVTPLRLQHGTFDVLGFRFGNLAYCTDTNEIPEETWPRLEGLDVLVLDCLRSSRHPTHFSLSEALGVARRVNARRTLLVHMSHDIRHAEVAATLPPGVELAYDGLVVPLVGIDASA
jgi:phosphoribosyl 1,2-cyclic phosphate phosphodiesterase